MKHMTSNGFSQMFVEIVELLKWSLNSIRLGLGWLLSESIKLGLLISESTKLELNPTYYGLVG